MKTRAPQIEPIKRKGTSSCKGVFKKEEGETLSHLIEVVKGGMLLRRKDRGPNSAAELYKKSSARCRTTRDSKKNSDFVRSISKKESSRVHKVHRKETGRSGRRGTSARPISRVLG